MSTIKKVTDKKIEESTKMEVEIESDLSHEDKDEQVRYSKFCTDYLVISNIKDLTTDIMYESDYMKRDYYSLNEEEEEIYLTFYKNQIKKEDEFLSLTRICHTSGDGSILGISVGELSGANLQLIDKKLKENFHDYTFMEEMRCLINTIIDIEDGNGKSERSRIHHFLENIFKFGSASNFNYAIRGDLVNSVKEKGAHQFSSNMFVVKCPREPSNAVELVHELLCGVMGLNKLRKKIFNYSYVYDAFYCSAPVVNDKTKEIVNWCMNSENPVSYVMYENIQNSVSIEDACSYEGPDCVSKFISYITQISLAEYLAEKECGFVHYDAHAGNVLIRNCSDSTFFLEYEFEDEKYYVSAPGEIATFIDYGMSRFKCNVGGEEYTFGKLDKSGYFATALGISPTHGKTITDIHKLLGFLLLITHNIKNIQLLDFISGLLFGYFYKKSKASEEEIRYFINKQRPTLYFLTDDHIEKHGYNMVDFINYLRDYCSEKYSVNIMKTTLSQEELLFTALPKESDPVLIKEELKISIPEIPSFFDLSQDPTNVKIIDNIKKNIFIIMQNEQKLIISNDSERYKIGFIDLRSVTENQFVENLPMWEEYINCIAKIIDNTFKLKNKMEEIIAAYKIIRLHELEVFAAEINTKIISNMEYLNSILSTLDSNYGIIKSVFKSEQDRINKKLVRYGDEENIFFNILDKYSKTVDSYNNINE